MSLDIQDSSASLTPLGMAVERYRNGDNDAWGEIFQMVEPSMHNWLIQRGISPHDRVDLIQEIFLHAQRKLPSLIEPNAFRAWLKTMTGRMAINHLTRRRAVVSLDEDLSGGDMMAEDIVDRTTPPDIVVREETRRLVRQVIRGMKKIDREILHGFYFNGLSLLELSAALDAPVGTIKRRLWTARRRFGQLMLEKNYL